MKETLLTDRKPQVDPNDNSCNILITDQIELGSLTILRIIVCNEIMHTSKKAYLS